MKKKSHSLPTEEIESSAISYIVQSWMCEVPHLPPTSWSHRISLEQGESRRKNWIPE